MVIHIRLDVLSGIKGPRQLVVALELRNQSCQYYRLHHYKR